MRSKHLHICLLLLLLWWRYYIHLVISIFRWLLVFVIIIEYKIQLYDIHTEYVLMSVLNAWRAELELVSCSQWRWIFSVFVNYACVCVKTDQQRDMIEYGETSKQNVEKKTHRNTYIYIIATTNPHWIDMQYNLTVIFFVTLACYWRFLLFDTVVVTVCPFI